VPELLIPGKAMFGFKSGELGKKTIDDDLLEQLEDQLLMADVGIQATQKITHEITQAASRDVLKDSESLLSVLKQSMVDILAPNAAPLSIDRQHKPFVILMVGVNGAGKTTTVGLGTTARYSSDQPGTGSRCCLGDF
jgi:signal recognition particle GTPase